MSFHDHHLLQCRFSTIKNSTGKRCAIIFTPDLNKIYRRCTLMLMMPRSHAASNEMSRHFIEAMLGSNNFVAIECTIDTGMLSMAPAGHVLSLFMYKNWNCRADLQRSINNWSPALPWILQSQPSDCLIPKAIAMQPSAKKYKEQLDGNLLFFWPPIWWYRLQKTSSSLISTVHTQGVASQSYWLVSTQWRKKWRKWKATLE